MLGMPFDEALELLTALLTERRTTKKIMGEANEALQGSAKKIESSAKQMESAVKTMEATEGHLDRLDELLNEKLEEAEKAARFLEVLQGS